MKRQTRAYGYRVKFLIFVASGFSFLVYLLVFRVFKYRYTVVISNISKAFPGISKKETEDLARRYYKHLGDLVVEPLLFIAVDSGTREKLANYTNIDLLKRLHGQASKVIVFASHCGNWEYLINLPEVQSFRTYTAYTPLSNKVIDRLMLKLRSVFGVVLIKKKYFFRGALSVLKKEEPSLVVVIADQRPAPGGTGHFVHFLQQPTQVQMGAERLASASGATVVFLECIKRARFHYDFTFRMITEEVTNCPPMEVTSIYYQLLEENIQKSPPYWLWSHKRWKPVVGLQHKTEVPA